MIYVSLALGSLLLVAAFSLAYRAMRKRRDLESRIAENEAQSTSLNIKVNETISRLLATENARRTLEVSSAVAGERERMMREIHDGIGAGLVAAIASAEKRGQENSTAIHALKGALADLKIAVDSLEPCEGNVATLLASLRYRLEPELNKSGVRFEWKVDEVPQMDWLTAPNALHVLRIFQEAIVNIISHADASVITMACHLDFWLGHPGVQITMSDNGSGFNPELKSSGHGRKNMEQRAEALGGQLRIASEIGKGSRISLWLPLVKS